MLFLCSGADVCLRKRAYTGDIARKAPPVRALPPGGTPRQTTGTANLVSCALEEALGGTECENTTCLRPLHVAPRTAPELEWHAPVQCWENTLCLTILMD